MLTWVVILTIWAADGSYKSDETGERFETAAECYDAVMADYDDGDTVSQREYHCESQVGYDTEGLPFDG